MKNGKYNSFLFSNNMLCSSINLKFINKSKNALEKTFVKSSKKSFFIKYLLNNNYIQIESDTGKILSKDINLSELLNEKNVTLNYYDIYRDYRNYRREYYLFYEKDYKKDDDKIQEEEQKKDKITYPFNEKNITLTLALKHLFINQSPLDIKVQYLKFFFFLLVIVFYYDYKRNHVRRINQKFYNQYKSNTLELKQPIIKL